MHVHAHPDDESSKGAASTAMYVAQGVDVHVVTCTGGERGSILNPKMDRPDVLENMTEIRRQEMERARDILGVRQDWLGLRRLRLARRRPEATAARGLLRPGAARGGGRAAGEADPRVQAARHDDVRRARRLPAPRPHQVPRDLGRGVRGGGRPGALPRARRAVAGAQALLPPLVQPAPDAGAARGDARPRAGVALGGAAKEWKPEPEWDARVTTKVPCGDYFGVRDQALLAHATQIDPDGFWFAIPREIQLEVAPTEDFELVQPRSWTPRCPRTTSSPVSPDA